MAIKSTLFEYWNQKEIELGHKITVSDVVRATGLQRNTIDSWLKNKTTRYHQPVIDALCKYFNAPPGSIPFLKYEHD